MKSERTSFGDSRWRLVKKNPFQDSPLVDLRGTSDVLPNGQFLKMSCVVLFACFLPPANEVCEGYVFTGVCHSVHRVGVHGCSWGGGHARLLGGHAWLLWGGMHGCSWGACVVALGVCVVALGGACMVAPGGACMVTPGGHAWLLWGGVCGCSGGGMCGCSGGHAWFFR